MHHLTRRQFLASTTAAAVTRSTSWAAPASADDPHQWAQFLGPRRDGISWETGLNTDWTKKKPAIVWKTPLGKGFSSISIVDNRLYTMMQRGDRDGVVCLDAGNGKELWFTDVVPSFLDRQRHGNGPRATPTFHQGKLYCLMGGGELLCLAADGRKLWEVNIFQEARTTPREDVYYWGMSGSPLVEGDLVIVQPGGNQDNSLVAFHKDSGKLHWRCGNDPAGYSSPIVITAGGRRQVISFTGQSALAVDPTAGKVIWRYQLGSKFDCNIATPLWANNLLFISAAYRAGCAALEITAEGAKARWQNMNLLNHFPTSVILDGYIYGCHGDLGANFIKCVELATGKELWDERRPGKCSLLAYQNHIVLQGERGATWLIEANPKQFVVKGQLEGLLSYKAWSQPALLNGRLYLKDDKQLVCLDLS